MRKNTKKPKPIPPDAVSAVDVLSEMLGDDPKDWEDLDQIGAQMDIGQLVYDAREEAKLTQAQLAKRIRTTQSAISRIEHADYRGHSLRLLVRVAHALGKRVELKLLPKDEPETAVAAKRKKR